MLPETTQSTHPIYTLFRDHEGEMVGMECQDEMVEMESQEAKGRRETLVCRDYLAHKVLCTLTSTHPFLSSDYSTINSIVNTNCIGLHGG